MTRYLVVSQKGSVKLSTSDVTVALKFADARSGLRVFAWTFETKTGLVSEEVKATA